MKWKSWYISSIHQNHHWLPEQDLHLLLVRGQVKLKSSSLSSSSWLVQVKVICLHCSFYPIHSCCDIQSLRVPPIPTPIPTRNIRSVVKRLATNGLQLRNKLPLHIQKNKTRDSKVSWGRNGRIFSILWPSFFQSHRHGHTETFAKKSSHIIRITVALFQTLKLENLYSNKAFAQHILFYWQH